MSNILVLIAGLVILIANTFVFLFLTKQVKFRPIVFILTALLAVLTSIFLLLFSLRGPRIEKDISQQIEKLYQVKVVLTDLQRFVSDQRDRLIESQKTIASLEDQKQKLEPIVKVDRQVLISLLQFHEERSRGRVWKDRFVGFFLGVVSSLLATLIISFIKKR